MDIEVNYKNKKRYKTARYPLHQGKFWTWLIWVLSKCALIGKKFKVEQIGTEDLKPPYMMLSNHMHFIDFELAAMATWPHPVSNVVSIDGYVGKWFLLEWIGAICTRKFTNDIHLVRSIRKVLRRGDILCMYPEARYSPCGVSSYIPDSVGYLIKSNKVPVVTVLHHGNYLHSPVWNVHKKRKVPLHTTMTLTLTAEEAATLYPNMEDTYPIVEQTMVDYTLKVMSFNVQTENGTQVDFDLRAEMLRDLMDQLQPDSIGMQEVTTGWIYRMDTFAFNASYAGVGEGRTPGGEASSIYYRKDKFDLVNSGTFWLSETPDEAGTYLEASLYPRICTWAHLRDKVTGYEYIHVNTHLDHLGGSDGRSLRTAQTRVILEYLKSLPDVPMVMTGDFNQAKTNSEDATYAIFKNVLGQSTFTASTGEKMTGNFSDARAEAKDTVASDAWASMTAYWQEGTDKYNPAKKPIDYVFYTTGDFTADIYRNIHYHRDGIYMSDHLPQYCELHVKVAADGE
mgnify:CR=1 FL=1